MMQTRHWVFTLNNWSADHDEALKALGPQVSYLVYGYETGEAGTPHLQGYVVFPRIKRRNEAAGLLPGNPHLEPKRGTPLEASDYCKKGGVFQEFGVVPSGGRGCTVFDDFIQWVLSYTNEHGHVPSEREIARKFPLLWLRNERKLRSLALHLAPQVKLLEDVTLKPWQRSLRDVLVCQAPDDRGIIFVVDEAGGSGKSFFQRYMVSEHPQDVQLLSIGKREDVAHAIDPTKSIFMFNIPRGGMEFLNYNVLEQIKDRVVFSPKYDSGTKFITSNPHVIIFCNEFPNMDKMTIDRYCIQNMEEEQNRNDEEEAEDN